MSKHPSLSGGQLSLDLFLVSKTRKVKENVAPSTSSKRKRLPKDDDDHGDRPFKKDKEQKKVQIPCGEKRCDREPLALALDMDKAYSPSYKGSTPLLHSRTVGGLQTPLSYGDTPMAKSKNKSTTKVVHTVQVLHTTSLRFYHTDLIIACAISVAVAATDHGLRTCTYEARVPGIRRGSV